MNSSTRVIVVLFFATGFMDISAGAALPIANSRQALDKLTNIQNYLNGIRTLQASFIQTNPDGSTSSGKMYLKRLGKESFGKLRLDYAPPSPLTIIANGEVLRQEDRNTGEADEYAIDSTPASFLLRHKIDFSQELEVKRVESRDNKIYVTMVRAGDDSVVLTLVFATSPLLRLQEWIIVDAQANETHVILSNVEIGIALPEKLFVF